MQEGTMTVSQPHGSPISNLIGNLTAMAVTASPPYLTAKPHA